MESAGYRVSACTGSAWIVTLPSTHVYAWTSRGRTSSGRLFGRVAGVPASTDGTRFSWRSQGRTVWVEAGPSGSDQQPERTTLAWVVLATQRVELRAEPLRFMPTPPAVLARCRSDALVRAACPTKIPAIPGWNLYPRVGTRGIFGLERGAQASGRPALDRPPAFLHLELARDLQRWVPWAWPTDVPVLVADGLVRRRRSTPVPLGDVTWGGRNGDLALAPRYPEGGSQGGHLVVRWRERGVEYAIGLHAWEPLDEAVATLRRIVESIP